MCLSLAALREGLEMSPAAVYNGAIRTGFDSAQGEASVRIGIPRSLFYYKHPRLWTTFFTELGQEVVLSPPTNRQTMEAAVRYGEDESCLAVKLVFGHISYLADKCDQIFAPAYYGLEPGRYSCPKFLGVPDISKSIFGPEIQFLRCEVEDGRFEPGMLQLGNSLSNDKRRIRQAVRLGLEARSQTKRELHEKYQQQLASQRPKIVVIGHQYVIHDSYANLNLLAKLKDRGMEVITIDSVPHMPVESFLKWDFAYETMGQLSQVLAHNIAGAIVLSNFNCGVDAITVPFVEDKLERHDIPCMHLVLDEHTGEAGLITRVDTFVDTVRMRRRA
jgi:predicted nucleotide-binding protein (sugar kinase/HSP70/actin superfamily)